MTSTKNPPVKKQLSSSGSHTISLCLFSLCAAISTWFADADPAANPEQLNPTQLQAYLLMGGAGIAQAQAVPAADQTTLLKRCWIINKQGRWESAKVSAGELPTIGTDTQSWSGPALDFAQEMLKQKPKVQIGLIFNAQPDTNIEDCCGIKTPAYRFSRKYSRIAIKQGTLKGMLWQGSGAISPLFTDLDHLENLISNIRTDLRLLELPFVAGETLGKKSANTQLHALTQDVHATAVAPTGSGGAGYAKAMLQLEKEWPDNLPTPKPTVPVIDPHIHAMAAKPGGLDIVAEWMKRNDVERCITSPLGQSRATTLEERKIMLENHRKYRGKIDRFCLIKPDEVATLEEAVKILKQEKTEGAVGFGEHYGHDLMFDDPKNVLLYQACGKVGLPVMFHIDASKNMVKQGMRRVERVLEICPDTKIIAHAYWWLHLPNGTCERMLSKYPNLYADVSGTRMVSVLNRDRNYSRKLLTQYQDRILFATDAGWWSFSKPIKERELQFELFERLGLRGEIKEKIYRKNAMTLFGWKPQIESPKE
ncbi:MAG: amidohydrolase family protein [Verrucomicrobiae bacterium]|nr:amidohydrolase family protein [Verrucomicrobiae bacterium]NNJ41945.1 amidohydrolase family protein [Akkermansiaceae bacterium]